MAALKQPFEIKRGFEEIGLDHSGYPSGTLSGTLVYDSGTWTLENLVINITEYDVYQGVQSYSLSASDVTFS